MHPFAVILFVPILLFLININHWYYLKTVMRKHDAFIKGLMDSVDDATKAGATKAQAWIMTNQTEIKRRVNRAGLRGPTKTVMEPLGLGFAGQQTFNVLDNLLVSNVEILQLARQTIEVAKGHYLVQAKRSLSPLYWLEVIVYLPKEIVSASGLDATSKFAEVAVKIAQIVYWLVLAAVAVMGYTVQR